MSDQVSSYYIRNMTGICTSLSLLCSRSRVSQHVLGNRVFSKYHELFTKVCHYSDFDQSLFDVIYNLIKYPNLLVIEDKVDRYFTSKGLYSVRHTG